MKFPVKILGNYPIICYVEDLSQVDQKWRIALPTALLEDVVLWFHLVLGHAGRNRMYDSIRARFHHPHLKRMIEKFNCRACQEHKLYGAGYGELPSRMAGGMPWHEVAVDLIGPWKINFALAELEFNALTIIDTVSNLTELTRIENKTAQHIKWKFEQAWLARYPWPQRCVHDNGGEFTGEAFQCMLELTGIKDVPTTSRNPQANAICERMHQTVGNILRTLLYTNPPTTMEQVSRLVDEALATAQLALRSAVSKTLGSSPGGLAFHRDMFLDIPLLADWQLVQQKRQILIDKNLRRQNAKRRSFDYIVGQRILIKAVNPGKLGSRTVGPFPITQVHTNGTITIARNQYVHERINIRRVLPFRS